MKSALNTLGLMCMCLAGQGLTDVRGPYASTYKRRTPAGAD